MKKLSKKLIYIISGLLFIALIMYKLTIWSQQKMYEKYGVNYNSKRVQLGLNPLVQEWNKNPSTSNPWFKNDPINGEIGLIDIFSATDIPIGYWCMKDSFDFKSTNNDKFIWFNTNLLFWRNGIRAESDTYAVVVNEEKYCTLTLTYHFEDDNGNKNYYEANYIESYADIINCGTEWEMEHEEQKKSGKPYAGNITKMQADSILNVWKRK